MPIYLHGLALQNFRGIGLNQQFLGPFREFNFFIGANNAGKSTILDFLSRYLTPASVRKAPEGLDRHIGRASGPPVALVGIPIEIFVNACSPSNHTSRPITALTQLLSEKGMVWIELPFQGETPKFSRQLTASDLEEGQIDPSDIQRLWIKLTNQSQGSLRDHWLPETLQFLLRSQTLTFPKVILIPAIRQIGPASESFNDYSGAGLIEKLASIQSPDHDKRADRHLFNSINKFVQNVTGHEKAEIEIPHNRAHILVHMDEKVLPLSSLGTGIHEVIMIAAFCTLCEKQIVCIEEPELHLHPLLQRKLLAYLHAYTNNQYFIATHSPSFIDTPNAAIFHVTNDGEQTHIHDSILRSERFAICKDLGTKASDILQSNAVVWVEGPSDRIYLRHWINFVDDSLVEGIHYSVMFYGGRLLSHLTANDDEVSEFISLRALNQHIAIVMDSDIQRPGECINNTKQRLREEFSKAPSVAWITAGKEIENYIEPDLINEALKAVHPDIFEKPLRSSLQGNALHFHRKNGKIHTTSDKVKVARHVCQKSPNFEIMDLGFRVNEIVDLIRSANHA